MSPTTSRRLLVLCYHNVDPTFCFPARPGAGQRGLGHQLRTLRRLANVIPLESGLDALATGRPLPPRAVALTFDDGYRDNLTLAVPMLERLELPATFFLVPGLLSNAALPWWEVVSWAVVNSSRTALVWEGRTWPLGVPAQRRAVLDEVQRSLKRRSLAERDEAVEELAERLAPSGERPSAQQTFLDWDEAGQLLTRGFAVGSHTCSHAILSGETPGEQVRDLAESRRQLQERMSIGADVLAYPNGTSLDYDDATLEAARLAGHTSALTTREGFNRGDTPPLELKRVVIYPERGVADLAVNLRYALRPAD